MFDHYAQEAQAYENQEPGKGWLFWGDVSNRWQAYIAGFFGLVMAAITIMLYNLSRKANKTAAQALDASAKAANETTRSVDAFVETERSRIHVRGVQVFDISPDPFERIQELHFVIENVGRGMGTIRGEWTDVTYLQDNTPIPAISRREVLVPAFQPVVVGQPITMTNEMGVEGRMPLRMPPRPDWATAFAFRILIRYETQFQQARFYGATFVGRRATNRIQRVFTEEHAFDEAVTDGSAHPGQFGPEQQADA